MLDSDGRGDDVKAPAVVSTNRAADLEVVEEAIRHGMAPAPVVFRGEEVGGCDLGRVCTGVQMMRKSSVETVESSVNDGFFFSATSGGAYRSLSGEGAFPSFGFGQAGSNAVTDEDGPEGIKPVIVVFPSSEESVSGVAEGVFSLEL